MKQTHLKPSFHVTHIEYRNVVFWSIVVLLVGVAGLYMYFISMSVVHIVLRQELSLELAERVARVGTLEARYLDTRESLHEERALELALVPVPKTDYVQLDQPTSVTLR